MIFKLSLVQLIHFILLLSQLSAEDSITPEEDEAQVNNRLRHYLKRLELVQRKNNGTFSAEIQQLRDTFEHALTEESYDEKLQLVENYTNNTELAEFLGSEFDKQFINEDILLEIWYLNEVLPYLDQDLQDEVEKILDGFKEVYETNDLEKKLNLYSDIGENISEKFLDYFYGENETVPLMNAQLKFYQEYLQYLFQEGNLTNDFEEKTQELTRQVEAALSSDDESEKEKVLDIFDDLSTKFGRYLGEHYIDFKMYKFGE